MFILTESCEGLAMVGFNDKYFMTGRGSYNVMGARILGLSYPDYLRYCRDEHQATLKGREGYSYPVFKNIQDAKDLIKILNKQYSEVIKKLEALDYFK